MKARLLLTYPSSVPLFCEQIILYVSFGMNSEVNAKTNALTSTETLVMVSKTLYQAPMSSTRVALGRRKWHKKLMASTLISTTTLMSANNGPRGNAATNMVIKPYCKAKTTTTKVNTYCPGFMIRNQTWLNYSPISRYSQNIKFLSKGLKS